MTQSTATKNKPSSTNGTTPVQTSMFIDWGEPVDLLDSCSLFDETDFTNCDLVFFDPYQFALSKGLRTKEKELGEVEYIDLDEKHFIEYLRQAKQAAEKFKNLLQNDGSLIIRSGIPKGHIKVSKRTSASVRSYTESVLSTFFWMDEVLGKSSFQECQAKILKYPQRDMPLVEVFRDCMVECHQAQISIGRGFTRVLAIGGPSGKLPLITKVSLKPEPGQIYFIPKFLVKDETEKLITAFAMMKTVVEPDYSKPTWLGYYEKQVFEHNPLSRKIEEIDLQIDALAKQRGVLLIKLSAGTSLPSILWEKGPKLRQTVKAAFDILDLEVNFSQADQDKITLEGPIENKLYRKVIISVAEPNAEPIPAHVVEEFVTLLDKRPKHPKAKGIMVGNGKCSFPPEKRDVWFDQAGVTVAQAREVCLITVLDLFTAAALVLSRSGTENQKLIKSSLVKDILAGEGLFELNRTKYGI